MRLYRLPQTLESADDGVSKERSHTLVEIALLNQCPKVCQSTAQTLADYIAVFVKFVIKDIAPSLADIISNLRVLQEVNKAAESLDDSIRKAAADSLHLIPRSAKKLCPLFIRKVGKRLCFAVFVLELFKRIVKNLTDNGRKADTKRTSPACTGKLCTDSSYQAAYTDLTGLTEPRSPCLFISTKCFSNALYNCRYKSILCRKAFCNQRSDNFGNIAKPGSSITYAFAELLRELLCIKTALLVETVSKRRGKLWKKSSNNRTSYTAECITSYRETAKKTSDCCEERISKLRILLEFALPFLYANSRKRTTNCTRNLRADITNKGHCISKSLCYCCSGLFDLCGKLAGISPVSLAVEVEEHSRNSGNQRTCVSCSKYLRNNGSTNTSKD